MNIQEQYSQIVELVMKGERLIIVPNPPQELVKYLSDNQYSFAHGCINLTGEYLCYFKKMELSSWEDVSRDVRQLFMYSADNVIRQEIKQNKELEQIENIYQMLKKELYRKAYDEDTNLIDTLLLSDSRIVLKGILKFLLKQQLSRNESLDSQEKAVSIDEVDIGVFEDMVKVNINSRATANPATEVKNLLISCGNVDYDYVDIQNYLNEVNHTELVNGMLEFMMDKREKFKEYMIRKNEAARQNKANQKE